MKQKKNWMVKHFDDYHEIQSDTHNVIELGCFPVEECGYCRYFGLFYNGRRPSLPAIIEAVLSKVTLGYFEVYGVNCGYDKDALIKEIKDAMKGD